MFDKFKPFLTLQKKPFNFQPTRFELWAGGVIIKKGETRSVISAKPTNVNGVEKMEVSFNDEYLNSELAASNIFDEFMTFTDRLRLITVPTETNCENVGIAALQNIVGATCGRKNFNYNEPYCCNIFISNNHITKISFSYGNPEKLLEFYADGDADDLDFEFFSSDHLRYENDIHVSGPHGGAPRIIKVQPNIEGKEGYTVSIYNIQNGQKSIQMAPKQMKIHNATAKKIELRGYGFDIFGLASFEDYGLTIFHQNGVIEKCVLHMYDRAIDIEYFQ